MLWQPIAALFRFLRVSCNTLRFLMIAAFVYNREKGGNDYARQIVGHITTEISKNRVKHLLQTHTFKKSEHFIPSAISKKVRSLVKTKDGLYQIDAFRQILLKWFNISLVCSIVLIAAGVISGNAVVLTAVVGLGWIGWWSWNNTKISALRICFEMWENVQACDANDPQSIWSLFMQPTHVSLNFPSAPTIAALSTTSVVPVNSARLFKIFRQIEHSKKNQTLSATDIQNLIWALQHSATSEDLKFLMDFKNNSNKEKSYGSNLSPYSSVMSPLVIRELHIVLYTVVKGDRSLKKILEATNSGMYGRLQDAYTTFMTSLIEYIQNHKPDILPFVIKESVETTHKSQFDPICWISNVFKTTKVFESVNQLVLTNQPRNALEDGLMWMQEKLEKDPKTKSLEQLLLSVPSDLLDKLEAAYV